MMANWTFEHHGDGAVGVSVVGDVDMAAEEPFTTAVVALFDGGTTRLEIDLTNVEFMDSAGLRTLMRLRHDYGDRVDVVAVSAAVRRLFEVAGVTEWLMPGTPGSPTAIDAAERADHQEPGAA
jgi:anti-sigma B factor antagonist